jgi:hypothetical protein
MKTTQYVRQEKAIAAADSGGIRQRWLWGLRLLRDPDAMSSEKSLRNGIAEQLIAAAKAAGLKLSEREIQYRLQCARAYPTEAEIANACAEFEEWSDLRKAGFPTYEVAEGEPLADHRTDAERKRDHARALLDLIGEQGSLFPLDQFEPVSTTLKELREYAEEMAELTARFAARDDARSAYLDELEKAADGDLSTVWQDAHSRLEVATGESKPMPPVIALFTQPLHAQPEKNR